MKSLIGGDVLPFCRDAVGVFYCPRRLGWLKHEIDADEGERDTKNGFTAGYNVDTVEQGRKFAGKFFA